MPQRTLSEGEFTAIKETLLRQAPDGLKEDEFHRWFSPRFEAALAEAENSNEPVSGGSLRRFVGNAAQVLNPVNIVSGLTQAVTHPIDTGAAILRSHGEQFDKAKTAFGEGRYSEAAGHGAAGILPVLGPMAADVGEQIASGDVAGGLGAGAGLIGGAALAGPAARVAGAAARPVAQAGARRLYQSALKPTKATLKDVRPKAGLTAQETLLQTGLDEGVPVTARGMTKVENLIGSLDAEVQARIAKIQASGQKVDPALVEQAIDDVVRDFTSQVNAQPDLAAIEAVRRNFSTNPNVAQQVAPATPANFAAGQVSGRPAQMQPGPIDPVVAQQMKTNTYQGLRGKFGQERGATIEAEKAGARGLREGIEQAGARAGVDDIAAVNAREGALISLEHALSDALRRRGNYDMLGLKPAVGAATAAASDSILPLLVTLVDRFPGLVSRAGIWINRTGTRSGRGTQAAARGAMAGQATSPSESRTRTTGSPWSEPVPER
jgi:hypothetical protein